MIYRIVFNGQIDIFLRNYQKEMKWNIINCQKKTWRTGAHIQGLMVVKKTKKICRRGYDVNALYIQTKFVDKEYPNYKRLKNDDLLIVRQNKSLSCGINNDLFYSTLLLFFLYVCYHCLHREGHHQDRSVYFR